MRIAQLQYLDAAIRHGSLRQAAHELGVSQPTLGAQIRRLEEELDLVLLSRGPSGVHATDTAGLLLPLIQRLIKDQAELLAEAERLHAHHSGNLQVGVVSALGLRLMPRIARIFRAKYPGIALAISELGSDEIVHGVESGQLDVGLVLRRADAATPADLRVADIALGSLHICVANSHPLAHGPDPTIHQLADRDLVTFPSGSFLHTMFVSLQATYNLTSMCTVSTPQIAQSIVATGEAVALSSGADVNGLRGDGDVVYRKLRPEIPLAFSIAMRSNERPSPAAHVFTVAVKSTIAVALAENRQGWRTVA